MSCSENSSDQETDQQELEEESGGGGSKVRCYECTFCRRGFTNAQALGGHMNIHRKDRAKAKQLVTPTPTSTTPPNSSSNSQNKLIFSHNYDHQDYSLSPSPLEISGHHHQYQYYSILEAHRNYNNMYFQPSNFNPLNPRINPPSSAHHLHASSYHHDEYLNHHHRSSSLHMTQELLGANLSLQIGPSSHVPNDELVRRSGIHKDAELDLELRLGHHHHPY